MTQNPSEVATKFGKSIDTFFANSFEEAETVMAAWMAHLEDVEHYSPDDPLFPATAVTASSNWGFSAAGFRRRSWQSTEPVRKIVNTAFARIDQPACGPQSFRHMLARHAVNSVAAFVAASQSSVTPTF